MLRSGFPIHGVRLPRRARRPSILEGHTAVWTGTEMIVRGGHDEQNDLVLATGARYDPASDSSGAPSP